MPTRPLCSSLHWIIGPRYEQTKEFGYLWAWLVEQRERFRQSGVELKVVKARNNPSQGEMEIILEHGRDAQGNMARAVIRALSTARETDLQGEEVTTATLSEAAEHPERIWTKYLAARTWKAMLPTTPKPHAEWIRRMVEMSKTGEGIGIAHFHYPRSANPLYNEERFKREERKAALRSSSGIASDDPMFAEQFLGEWVYYTGRVLPFDPYRHVVFHDTIPLKECRIFCSVDYGYNDPTVVLFWALSPGGILFLWDEIYERQLTTQQVVEQVRDKLGIRIHELMYVAGDPARPEVARVFRDEGIPVFDIDKRATRDRAAGHRRLVDVLTEGPAVGQPGLFLSDRCTHTIDEWRTLHYKENAANEYAVTAIEGEDHAYDAARYGLMTRPTPKSVREERDWLYRHQQEVKTRVRRKVGTRLLAHGFSQRSA